MPRSVAGKDATNGHMMDAVELKDALWKTLLAVRSGEMLPGPADAVASQAREILRVVKIQLAVCAQSKKKVPREVVDFATTTEVMRRR